jgi:threonine dehydratase
VHGEHQNGEHQTRNGEARERAAALARSNGMRLVEDSLDIETCEGEVTIGLELVDTLPSFDAVLIALGGGALATGVGHVVKASTPDIEVICVQPLGAQAMAHSWRRRRLVTTDSTDTIADGVAGQHVVTIVCGSNVDVDAYHRWVGADPLHRF